MPSEFIAHPPWQKKGQVIDMWAGYPTPKEAKKIQKFAPRCWESFFGKKYILPNYRAPHYCPQDFCNYMEWGCLTGLPFSDYRDEIMNATFCNTAAGLICNRPTLFLERELAIPLLNGPLPEDMMADDFKWKWPGFKIYLPERLINLDEKHWLMFLDLSVLENREPREMLPEFAKELDRMAYLYHPTETPNLSYQNFSFHYPDRAIIVSGIINAVTGTEVPDLTTYALVKPFAKYTVAEIKAMTEHLKSAWACDKADDAVTHQMEHLALQVLLFLSAYPLEYDPKVLRPASRKGDRHLSALLHAKFVGQSQIRPRPGEPHHIASAATVIGAGAPGGTLSYERGSSSGWHLSPHWRSGHWVRQPYGPKSTLRKLIWVNTMPVGFEKEGLAKLGDQTL